MDDKWTKSGVMADLEAAGEHDLIAELIETFIRDSGARLDGLKTAAESMDFHALSGLSHSLKGSALLMNADVVVETCRGIEAQAVQRRELDYPALIRVLAFQLEEAAAAMRAYVTARRGCGTE